MSKTPHICPLCRGKKKSDEIKKHTVKLHDDSECKNLNPHSVWNMCKSCRGAFYHEYDDCDVCEGKGIVWG